MRGLVVDPDLHAGGAAQGDVALHIHGDARRVLQHVGGGTRLHRRVLGGVVVGLLAINGEQRPLALHHHFADSGRTRLYLDGAQVHVFGDNKLLLVVLVSHKEDHHAVTAIRNLLQLELTLFVRRSISHQHAVALPHKAHIGVLHRLSGTLILQDSCNRVLRKS